MFSNTGERLMTEFSLDASGLRCPMPLLKTKLQLASMQPGDRLSVLATDPGSAKDIPAYISLSPHRLIESEDSGTHFKFVIERGN